MTVAKAATFVLLGLPHYAGGAAALLNAIAVTLAVGIPFVAVRLRHHALLPMIGWHAVIDAWAFLHTSSVVAQGNPSTKDVIAGLTLPVCIALGYASWYASRRRRGLDAVTGS
jgi:hypothetical protein